MTDSSLFDLIPDTSSLQIADTSALTDVLGVLQSLDGQGDDSPMLQLFTGFGDVEVMLDIDLSGLTSDLPQSLDVMQNALSPATLEYVESLQTAYSTATDFLNNNALVQQLGESDSVQDVALTLLESTLTIFEQRLDDLSGGLIDDDLLQQLQDTYTALQTLQGNPDVAQLLPFITENLLGLSPDVLDGATAITTDVYNTVLISFEDIDAALGTAQRTLDERLNVLITAVTTFDPADAAAYTQIQAQLNLVDEAGQALVALLLPFYQAAQTAVDSFDWQSLMSAYAQALAAIDLSGIPTADDVINQMAAMIDNLLARVYMTFGADDLRHRINVLNQAMRSALLASPLAQVRDILNGYLDGIREAIEGIPTEQVQETVEDLLGRVGEEIDKLGLQQIEAKLDEAFNDVTNFVTTAISTDVKDSISGALDSLRIQIEQLPVVDLISQLDNAIQEIDSAISGIDQTIQQNLDGLRSALDELDNVTFEPISNEVIAQIDKLKAKLAEINPNALSEPEKFAIKGALAILEAIDIQGEVVINLKGLYHQGAEAPVRALLDKLAGYMDQIRKKLDQISPRVLLAPINDILDEADALADKLNGRMLLSFFYDKVDDFGETLADINPGKILEPLQAPYDSLMARVERLNPDTWVAPLNDLYAEIDALIDRVDITPLFDELDRRQRELFQQAQAAILAGLDSANLPEPLDSFLDVIRPVLELLTESIFGDPRTELARISIELQNQIKLSTLFEPLDIVFDQLLDMLRQVPQNDLVSVMNGIREGIGLALEYGDPRRVMAQLRQGQAMVASFSPERLLGPIVQMAQIRATFNARAELAPPERGDDIITVQGEMDVLVGRFDRNAHTSSLAPLETAHRNLAESLRREINALDNTQATAAYMSLRANMDRLLPDFLRQQAALSYSDIFDGLNTLRPTVKARRLDETMNRFLAKLKPITDELGDTMNNFFGMIREAVQMLSPISLKAGVEDIYDTIRSKLRILDPAALSASLSENIYEPLIAPLEVINPAQIAARINAAFEAMVAAVIDNLKAILGEIEAAISEKLREIRSAVKSVIESVRDLLNDGIQRLDAIFENVKQLAFVEILAKLDQLVINLGMSFDKELDRVSAAFSAMLDAIPLEGSGSVSISASVGG